MWSYYIINMYISKLILNLRKSKIFFLCSLIFISFILCIFYTEFPTFSCGKCRTLLQKLLDKSKSVRKLRVGPTCSQSVLCGKLKSTFLCHISILKIISLFLFWRRLALFTWSHRYKFKFHSVFTGSSTRWWIRNNASRYGNFNSSCNPVSK